MPPTIDAVADRVLETARLIEGAHAIIRDLRRKLALAGVEGSPPPGQDTTIGALIRQRNAALMDRGVMYEELRRVIAERNAAQADAAELRKGFDILRAEYDAMAQTIAGIRDLLAGRP